ncbi:class I SAM-dependent methyltransferase [Azospirillum sp. ST 5-10]|uniref:class I SAM-dependent methyltransferase n=1 Tax=unclassified Azospirillum TaxID=2630922 RepID=UPI003F4A48D5
MIARDSAPPSCAGAASPWVARFAALVPAGGPVLDLACGGGRHLRWLRERGHPVTGVDRDLAGVADLAGAPGIELLAADLEDGSPWPLAGRRFAGIVVANYLHRPLFPHLIAALAPGGALLYETFAAGNERFGRPANPAFLLRPGELLEAVAGRLQVVAYEHGVVDRPRPAVVQRIAAVAAAEPCPLPSP